MKSQTETEIRVMQASIELREPGSV